MLGFFCGWCFVVWEVLWWRIKIYLDNCCFNRSFDYTEWRQDLDEDASVEEISRRAMTLRNKGIK